MCDVKIEELKRLAWHVEPWKSLYSAQPKYYQAPSYVIALSTIQELAVGILFLAEKLEEEEDQVEARDDEFDDLEDKLNEVRDELEESQENVKRLQKELRDCKVRLGHCCCGADSLSTVMKGSDRIMNTAQLRLKLEKLLWLLNMMECRCEPDADHARCLRCQGLTEIQEVIEAKPTPATVYLLPVADGSDDVVEELKIRL